MEYHDFLSEMFCLTVPKKILQESFRVRLFWYRNFFCIRGVGQDFLTEIFCRTVPVKKIDEYFSVSLISGIEKFYALEG